MNKLIEEHVIGTSIEMEIVDGAVRCGHERVE